VKIKQINFDKKYKVFLFDSYYIAKKTCQAFF
jgi:hypothetical protein